MSTAIDKDNEEPIQPTKRSSLGTVQRFQQSFYGQDKNLHFLSECLPKYRQLLIEELEIEVNSTDLASELDYTIRKMASGPLRRLFRCRPYKSILKIVAKKLRISLRKAKTLEAKESLIAEFIRKNPDKGGSPFTFSIIFRVERGANPLLSRNCDWVFPLARSSPP